jgi:hypothetical protein
MQPYEIPKRIALRRQSLSPIRSVEGKIVFGLEVRVLVELHRPIPTNTAYLHP